MQDKLLNLVKETLTEEKFYSFKIKDRKVKVVFSENPDASTVENALVKIVTKNRLL